MNRQDILSIIEKAPSLLEDLISEIPGEILKLKRRPGKWSIHENACHLAEVHRMMIERFKLFKTVRNPVIKPYLPGSTETPDDYLMDLDLHDCLGRFRKDRAIMLDLLQTFSEEDWTNPGSHPEYIKFNPEIFLRHIMMHDHLHMYRIEELWLTTPDYL